MGSHGGTAEVKPLTQKKRTTRKKKAPKKAAGEDMFEGSLG